MIVGVDSAKNRIDAVALLDGKIADWFTMAIPTRKVISRDRTLKDLRFSFNFWLHCLVVPPTLYVEAPLVMNGRQTAVSLAETVGMILSLPYPAELVAIDSSKEIFGERQDLFDATGVAIFGHRSGRTSPATDPA
jgi:hypothetical protein